MGPSASFGRPRRHHRLTGSTNERAKALAEGGAPHGTIVTASEQSAGRGRHGRVWTAPAGKALLFSAVLRPLEPRHALLPLGAPVAVCETVEALGDARCELKWPNDVWIEGRKVAGVLIEANPSRRWAVIGVGLNVAIEPEEFPPELRDTATSLGQGTVEAALAALCERLGPWVQADPAAILAAYRERDALKGRKIAWEGAGGASSSGEGAADGIADDGNLVVVTRAGERLSLGAGEVHLSLD